ncbi:sensor domain-containing diguanylate cyclase [Sulfurimonas paralvinellae]|uniref:diguanylate cyclase n=1 Tax=Sulfurimonas paralvinellae TaxID=317658 RepID=A0A7M1BA11_9BACT|nr:diguanylate cyclase [Sulfurimonas paralvinellae]QOP46560.1 diguanylate cyclase [Sulfurimonas paralvinellae]
MFYKNFFKNNRRPLLISLIFFAVVEAVILLSTSYLKQKDINYYLDIFTNNLETNINMTNAHLSELTQSFYDFKINNPKVDAIMAKAAATQDKHERDRLRKELFRLLNDDYKKMHHYGIRQLHFHLPNSISFLRFHRPNKYGDSLQNVRETIDYVNKRRIPISAFEEGRIFNGFRNVYPIFHDGEFVGTVELSFSFLAMQEFLTKTDHTSYLFLIKQEVVNKKVFTSEKRNYQKSEFDGFDYDKATLSKSMQMRLNKMFSINKAISKQVAQRVAKGESFSIYFHQNDIYNDSPIIISFIAVPNLDSKTVAYILNYQFGDTLKILIKNSHMIFIILSLLLIFISLILFIYFYNDEKRRAKIFQDATHDALTGLYNRHAVNYFFKQKIDESKRYHKPLSIIFCDIDFFKKINDTYGHDIGDYVLKGIAAILQNHLRSSDISARWGGEEFIIFLPETSLEEAVAIAQKLRKIIEASLFSSIETTTCSFGVTQLREDDTSDSLLKRVDELLYRAKENGRNRVEND